VTSRLGTGKRLTLFYSDTDTDPAPDPLHWMKYPFNGRCDVTKRDELLALYEGAEKHFGSAVEVFCNNAGINHVPGWRKCMDIDIVSIQTLFLTFEFFCNFGNCCTFHVVETGRNRFTFCNIYFTYMYRYLSTLFF
jgi:hypothetical protein